MWILRVTENGFRHTTKRPRMSPPEDKMARYDESRLTSMMIRDSATFIAAYKNNNKLDNLNDLCRECYIEGICGRCENKNVFKKIFRNADKTGAICEQCKKIQKVERTAATNIPKFGSPCAAQGKEQIEKRKATAAMNREKKGVKPYHKQPDDARLGSLDKFGCIYLITCLVNGMRYVGYSKFDTPDERYDEHWHKRDESKPKTYLHKAMDLYGKDQFTVERLCVVPHAGLLNMEAYYAEQFQTYIWDDPGGYNMIWCGVRGNLGVPHSASTRAKISERANNRSPESRARYSEAAKRRAPQKRSAETKAKQSAAGKLAWERNRATRLEILHATHDGKKRPAATCKKISDARNALFGNNRVETVEAINLPTTD
jgi:group I intron endonuclease